MPADFSVIAVDRVDLSDEELRRRLHDGVRKLSRRGMVKAGNGASLPGISVTGRAISRICKLIQPWANNARRWKRNGAPKSTASFICGHTPEHVRRNPKIPARPFPRSPSAPANAEDLAGSGGVSNGCTRCWGFSRSTGFSLLKPLAKVAQNR
jgi:hypothetical protein